MEGTRVNIYIRIKVNDELVPHKAYDLLFS